MKFNLIDSKKNKELRKELDKYAKQNGYVYRGFRGDSNEYDEFSFNDQAYGHTDDEMDYYFGNGSIFTTSSKDIARTYIPDWFYDTTLIDNLGNEDEITDKFTMQLYINPGTKPLIVNTRFSDWNKINFNGEIVSTGQLVKYAKDNGFTSLVLKNVKDNGENSFKGKSKRNYYATDIAVFNANQIKSADLHTYDNQGNEIPYEKRFNKSSNKLYESSGESVKIETNSVDAYCGQIDMIKSAIKDNKLVGYLQYSIYRDRPHIQMIEVADGYKRQGIATMLLRDLQNDFPNTSIDLGMTTPDGTLLTDKVVNRVENPQWRTMVNRITTINDRLKEIDEYWEKFYAKLDKMEFATDEMRNESDKIWEEQQQLEDEKRELEDKLEDTEQYFNFIK